MIMSKLLIFLLLSLLSISLPLPIFASPPTSTVEVNRLTSGFYREDWPIIYDHKVYWTDPRGGVYGYDFVENSEFLLIESSTLTNFYAAIDYDGRYLIYNSYDGISYNVNVYDFEQNLNIPVTEGVGSKWATDYDDKVIVYVDGGACGKLYAYYLLTEERKLITEQVCGTANISRRYIVWGYAVPTGSGIFGYDLKLNKKYDIAIGPGYRSSPDIYKDKIIWSINNSTNAEVYLYDIKTEEEKLIYTAPDYSISWPSISNKYAVWGKNTAQHVAGVEGIDLKTDQIFEIQEQGQHQNDNMTALVEGDIVAWMAWRTGNGDIYAATINR